MDSTQPRFTLPAPPAVPAGCVLVQERTGTNDGLMIWRLSRGRVHLGTISYCDAYELSGHPVTLRGWCVLAGDEPEKLVESGEAAIEYLLAQEVARA